MFLASLSIASPADFLALNERMYIRYLAFPLFRVQIKQSCNEVEGGLPLSEADRLLIFVRGARVATRLLTLSIWIVRVGRINKSSGFDGAAERFRAATGRERAVK